jgi:hypothetical protein
MSLLVIGYPTIAEVHFLWIQQIRAQHDRLYYDVVAPHFTLVFPVVTIDQQIFLEHVKQESQDMLHQWVFFWSASACSALAFHSSTSWP